MNAINAQSPLSPSAANAVTSEWKAVNGRDFWRYSSVERGEVAQNSQAEAAKAFFFEYKERQMVSAFTYIVQFEPDYEPFEPLKDYDCTIELKETTADAKTYVITSPLDSSNLLNTISGVIGYTAISVITVKRVK